MASPPAGNLPESAVYGSMVKHLGPTQSAAVLFVALTLIATFPIVTAPGKYVYFNHPDAQLNMWIMAWDAHQLPRHPLHLFDANIFYPAPRTLTFSETLLGYLPLFGPILWLGGSPVLAFNIVLLFSFAASGLCMYLLAFHLTGRFWPSIVAGVMYAFMPYRFVHVPQIQLEAMEWIPLAFLCLHLFVDRGDVKYTIGLGASVVMQTLCCIYYGVFLTAALVLAGIVLFAIDRRAREPRKLVAVVLVGAASALLVAPIVGEYLHVHHLLSLERSYAEIIDKAADLRSYRSSAAPLHQILLGRPFPPPHDFLFPGFLALALAALGVVVAARRQTALYVTVALFGLWASFGPPGIFGVSLYAPLYRLIPVFHGLRQISRFAVLALFAVSVLAALGCAVLETEWKRSSRGLIAAMAVLAFAEGFSAPLMADRPDGAALDRVPVTPAVYQWLAEQRGSFAVLELPLPHYSQFWRNAPYVYWSTVHWQPLVNGYSGFAPRDYNSLWDILNGFPNELAWRALLVRKVRYVVVHTDKLSPGDASFDLMRLKNTSWLRLVTRFPDTDLFEVQQVEPISRRVQRPRS